MPVRDGCGEREAPPLPEGTPVVEMVRVAATEGEAPPVPEPVPLPEPVRDAEGVKERVAPVEPDSRGDAEGDRPAEGEGEVRSVGVSAGVTECEPEGLRVTPRACESVSVGDAEREPGGEGVRPEEALPRAAAAADAVPGCEFVGDADPVCAPESVALPEGEALSLRVGGGERDAEGDAVGETEPRAVREPEVEGEAGGEAVPVGSGVPVEKGGVGVPDADAEAVTDTAALALALAQGDAEALEEGEGDCVPVAPPSWLAEGLPLTPSDGDTLPEALTVGVAVTVAEDVPLWHPLMVTLSEPDTVTVPVGRGAEGEAYTEAVVDREAAGPREPDTVAEPRPVPVGAATERVGVAVGEGQGVAESEPEAVALREVRAEPLRTADAVRGALAVGESLSVADVEGDAEGERVMDTDTVSEGDAEGEGEVETD